MTPVRRARLRRVACIAVTAIAAGCTIPITAQTITGGALNAGAMFMVDRLNDESATGAGRYDYLVDASAAELTEIFEAAVADANRRHMFPDRGDRAASESPPAIAEDGDGVVLASRRGRPARRGDPPEPETFPDRQWTPSPMFGFRGDAPEARGDTLLWVVTHRAERQVAFLLVPRGKDGRSAPTRVALMPYDPPADVFLSVPADHAQRNAVEALHQAFYFAVTERLGDGAFRVRYGAGRP